MNDCPDCDAPLHGSICRKCGFLVPDSAKPKPAWVPPQSYPAPKKNDDYRKRWYEERGLPFEKAKLGRDIPNLGSWQSVGGSAGLSHLLDRMKKR